ncbi:MAG: Xaa-Pro peptidase family protein [Candidatus Omnitrophota bacterium]
MDKEFNGIERVKKLSAILSKDGLDSILITSAANVRYLSGFSGGAACLFISKGKRFFITDSRYELQAKKDTAGFDIIILKRSLPDSIADLVKDLGIKIVGFEPDSLTYSRYERISKGFGQSALRPFAGAVEELRERKDSMEIQLVRKSVSILKSAVDYFKSILKPGITENELAARTEYFIRHSGGEGASFDIIVASGGNSAFPHAKPQGRAVKANDMVLLDLGVNYRGYNSDLTRVFFLGKITSKRKKIYDIVKQAQKRAIELIAGGTKIFEIDAAARDFIRQEGFGGCFNHALGHGIGLEIHENPSLSGSNQAILKQGMIFTVEPAIYLPGWGGIRIEDMILVKKKGYEVLTDDIDK